VLEHYAITWGVKLPENTPNADAWKEWGLKEAQAIRDEDD
jgi:hypothetical protein